MFFGVRPCACGMYAMCTAVYGILVLLYLVSLFVRYSLSDAICAVVYCIYCCVRVHILLYMVCCVCVQNVFVVYGTGTVCTVVCDMRTAV